MMQLVLLTLGIAIGPALAGANLDEATADTPYQHARNLGALPRRDPVRNRLYVHFPGPPRSLGWLLAVLMSACVGEQLGGRLVSGELGPIRRHS